MTKIMVMLAVACLLAACVGQQVPSSVKMPYIYNCRIGIVEGDSEWNSAELRRGMDVLSLKLATGEKHPTAGFSIAHYESEDGEILFTLAPTESLLIINTESYRCAPID